jgi:hypothetical protein
MLQHGNDYVWQGGVKVLMCMVFPGQTQQIQQLRLSGILGRQLTLIPLSCGLAFLCCLPWLGFTRQARDDPCLLIVVRLNRFANSFDYLSDLP